VNYCCLQSVVISVTMVIRSSIAMGNCLRAKGSGGQRCDYVMGAKRRSEFRRFCCSPPHPPVLVSFRFGVGGSALSAVPFSANLVQLQPFAVVERPSGQPGMRDWEGPREKLGRED
jgi:hypothetical protein